LNDLDDASPQQAWIRRPLADPGGLRRIPKEFPSLSGGNLNAYLNSRSCI